MCLKSPLHACRLQWAAYVVDAIDVDAIDVDAIDAIVTIDGVSDCNPTLSSPLPQPCCAWSMIRTWQQV